MLLRYVLFSMLFKDMAQWRREREDARWQTYAEQAEQAEQERIEQEYRRIMREAFAEADRIYVIKAKKAVYDPARYKKGRG